MNTNNIVVDPDNWDEVSPLLGGFPLRLYEELTKEPDYALPGFYENDEVLAFQPGWDGQDGGDAVHWADARPTVGAVRERIASLLVSSWLVQDRDDATKFFLGDEPGAIVTPYGVTPAYVIFAPRKGAPDDAPWENLRAVLADVDAALEAGAPSAGGFVDWRLRNSVPARTKMEFHLNPDGALIAVFRLWAGADYDVPVFAWNTDGSPRGGEVEEYEPGGAIGLYESYPLRNEADLEAFLACFTAHDA